MGSGHARNCANNEKMGHLSAPPGFVSLTSFTLRKVEKGEKTCESNTLKVASEQNPIQINAADISHSDVLKRTIGCRPGILFNQSLCNREKSETERPDLVNARWCSTNARKVVLEEAPVFHPTEEEFEETLKYISTIRSVAEPFGFCRIIPPSSWHPPCLFKEKDAWERSRFTTHVQRIDGLQCSPRENIELCENIKTKRRRVLESELGNEGKTKGFESKIGPEFTLKSFKSMADDFKGRYFCCDNKVNSSYANPSGCEERIKLSLEDVEGEYRQIVENPTEEIEVLFGYSIDTGAFGSGFPMASKSLKTSDYDEYVKSGWNLNNVPRLPASLLSFEQSGISPVLVPQICIGMCFSSLYWKVEEHNLYSLCYIHMGEPKIWYGIPGRFSAKFEIASKKYLQYMLAKQPDLRGNLVPQLSPSMLMAEGIPVYRCAQSEREFVVIFPGVYHSGFGCGFNCCEAVNFAPLDWLPHGQNAVDLYREQRRKTSISLDKLLLGAAREAVRAQWEISLSRKETSENLFWKDNCGKDGILAKAFSERIKSECIKREYLCSSLQSKRMEKDFDATCKRECSICMYDLHFSAVGCSCTVGKYSCLNHAKELCSCTWSNKILLYRYEISELHLLLEALEGKLKAFYWWAKEQLGLALSPAAANTNIKAAAYVGGLKAPKELENDRGQSRYKGMFGLKPKTSPSISSIREEIKARVFQRNELKRKHNAMGGSQVTATYGESAVGSASSIKAETKVHMPQPRIPSDLKAKQIDKPHVATTPSGLGGDGSLNIRGDMDQSVPPNQAEENTISSKFVALLQEDVIWGVPSASSSESSSSESEDT